MEESAEVIQLPFDPSGADQFSSGVTLVFTNLRRLGCLKLMAESVALAEGPR